MPFKELRSTVHLNLSGRRLRILSGAVIGAVASHNATLTDLNLENNELGPGGANAIVLGISTRPVLRSLNLSDCGLAGSKSWELLTQRSARSDGGQSDSGKELGEEAAALLGAALNNEQQKQQQAQAQALAQQAQAQAQANAPVDPSRAKRARKKGGLPVGGLASGGPNEEEVELTEEQLDIKTRARLAELMVSIGQISTLETLSLDNNKLSDAESALLTPIGKLSNLRSLSLCGNKLTEVPSSIGSLRSLSELLLRSNQLNELPTASIGLLGSLENLDLKGNFLTNLPDTIGQLRALKNLDLSENKLTGLPASLGMLRDNLKLAVSRNPLQLPPLSVARQGIDAIRRYFNELKKSGSVC